MKEIPLKHTTIFHFEIFGQYHEVRHFVTSRLGGTSKNQFSGFNMGFGTDDDANAVLKNRQLLSESLGVPLDWFVFPRQTHSANIQVINKEHQGKGVFSREDAIPDTDALICNEPNTFITIQVADCVPILLLDIENRAIAAIHAGWRGTVQQITRLTIEAMQQHFGTKAEYLVAGIGPSIGNCCYHVGTEVQEQFTAQQLSEKGVFEHRNENLYLDLWAANKNQLLACGVKQQNIEVAKICTNCNNETFFSSRHGKGDTGRFTAGIMLQ